MISQHFLNKYNRFISNIQSLGKRNLEYYETHHIIPRCMGGTDDIHNLINLSFREHFLAHWMLYMAYPKNYKLANAFHFMCSIINGTPAKRREMRLKYGITSRAFESLKKQVRDLGRANNIGMVSCYDNHTNTKVRISSFEYALYPDRYIFHTKGMTYCYNMKDEIYEYISKDLYQGNKDVYMAITKQSLPSQVYKMYDPLTNDITKLSYAEVQQINEDRPAAKKLIRVIKHKIRVKDPEGKTCWVTLDEYHNGDYEHHHKGKINVWDTNQQIQIQISKEQYESDPQRYLTSTKGKVLAYDTVEQKNVVIDKELFDKKRYVGQTKNLTSVFDKVEQKWVQITREQAKDKSRYQGPCAGKVNVIDITTGIRSQINKSELNSQIHLPLGDKKYYFKARYVPKDKVKNIHIYEWKILDHTQYEIQDLDVFQRLSQTYLNQEN